MPNARTRRILAAAAVVLAIATAGAASADPCTAIPDSGPAPAWLRTGATFSGPVAHVIDGDSLCVDTAPENPGHPRSAWVEVRLEDLDAAELHAPGGREATERLRRAVEGRTLQCTVGRARRGGWRSYDRAVATCRIDGESLAVWLRR